MLHAPAGHRALAAALVPATPQLEYTGRVEADGPVADSKARKLKSERSRAMAHTPSQRGRGQTKTTSVIAEVVKWMLGGTVRSE